MKKSKKLQCQIVNSWLSNLKFLFSHILSLFLKAVFLKV